MCARRRHASALVPVKPFLVGRVRRESLHEYLSRIVHFIFAAGIYLRIAPRHLPYGGGAAARRERARVVLFSRGRRATAVPATFPATVGGRR